ncbi:hypothetical protein ACFLYE_01710 [Chloroflexota bacterium]
MVKVKVFKPKPKVVTSYSAEEIKKMLAVCNYDYEHNAQFLASRNQAINFVLLGTDTETGYIKVLGKGAKER